MAEFPSPVPGRRIQWGKPPGGFSLGREEGSRRRGPHGLRCRGFRKSRASLQAFGRSSSSSRSRGFGSINGRFPGRSFDSFPIAGKGMPPGEGTRPQARKLSSMERKGTEEAAPAGQFMTQSVNSCSEGTIHAPTGAIHLISDALRQFPRKGTCPISAGSAFKKPPPVRRPGAAHTLWVQGSSRTRRLWSALSMTTS